jgi:hypothetical protein
MRGIQRVSRHELEWSDQYSYNPGIELISQPNTSVLISIWYERNLYSDNYVSKELRIAFYWRIEVLDKTSSPIINICSLDLTAYPEFFDLEDCKKKAEDYYFNNLIANLKTEIAEEKALTLNKQKALKILEKNNDK